MDGEAAEEAGIADQKDDAETDEPDGSGRKTVLARGADWDRRRDMGRP